MVKTLLDGVRVDINHAGLPDVTSDQHHAQAHSLTSHSTRTHSELTGIGADDHYSSGYTLQQFVYDLLDLLGDVRALYVFESTGTTLTDRSRNQRVLTWSEEVGDFDTPPSSLGSGFQVTFNGSDEFGDAPDSDDLSFGDGKVDQPFSVFTLVNLNDATSSVMMAKWDATGTGEWWFILDASDRLEFRLADVGNFVQIAVRYTTPLSENAPALLVATYDGLSQVVGMNIYLNGAQVDDTDIFPNPILSPYTAMPNSGALLSLGYLTNNVGTKTVLFDGSMALAGVVGKELTLNEVWVLKELCNSYFGLSL